jgi:hypothetical protein
MFIGIDNNFHNKIEFKNKELIDNKFYKYINFKLQNKINVPINKAQGAIFLFIPSDNCSGGYRTLLKYIEFLRKNNIYVDIYFGDNFNNINTDVNGLSNLKYNIDHIINIINTYNEININEYNFYLGLYVRRKYNFILSNAWQIADAVYYNKIYANKLGYIIQDLEYLFFDDYNYKSIIENTYKSDYYYYCITSYLSKHINQYSKNIFESKLCCDNKIYYNMNITRENSVLISYYKNKKHRLPCLVENIINILSNNNIKCYVFPDIYNINSKNIINLGRLTIEKLNEYYNKIKIGIIFSNSNPSRIGFEMLVSGMHVIEYDSEYTKYDLSNSYFTKISNEQNIVSIINNLFDKENNTNDINEYIKSLDLNNELNNILNFTKQLLI